ncbi:hypothetical protein SBI_09810 [Streptomyces bingchenggensis BCW-1]|uniref:Uncharacterized protein n=2 Tax=Streptomyces TaxID=1883 RepID=D7CD86_STRBB|nr:hypothetical protein SBI_09810 [Streptomyces bingchenggensis BCW-1]
MNLRRRRSYDRDAPEWHTIGRRLRPLDVAHAAMRCPDTPHHRRAITDAIGLILLRAAELETAQWHFASLPGSGHRGLVAELELHAESR